MSELDIFAPMPENRRNADDMGMPPSPQEVSELRKARLAREKADADQALSHADGAPTENTEGGA